nr:hypothetical protein [Aestuariivivens insulae]
MIRYASTGNPVDSKQLLKTVMERLNLSARAYDSILKVARTIVYFSISGGYLFQHLLKFNILSLGLKYC